MEGACHTLGTCPRNRGARQNGARKRPGILSCVKQPRYSHSLNTQRVRDRDRAPLSMTNNKRKCLILGNTERNSF